MVARKYKKAAEHMLNPVGRPPSRQVDAKQFKIGMKIEMEHTSLKWVAERIVLNHLAEFPNYYTNLVRMERRMAKGRK